MSLLATAVLFALSAPVQTNPPVPPKPAWNIADCRKALSSPQAGSTHVCTVAHLEADLSQLVSGLSDTLEEEWRDFPRWLVERGGVESGAAPFSLGDLYYNGQGVRRDFAKAAVWYRKAAEQGLAGAQFNLGLMYANGDGVPQDYQEAHKWLNLAAARTTGESQNTYATTRDRIAKYMTPEQIGAAQKLTREWTDAFEKRNQKRGK